MPGQQTDPETDLGMDLSTDHQAEIIHLTHHKILDQITEVAVTPVTMIHTTDKATIETTTETEGTSNNRVYEQRNQNYQNRYDNNQDRNRLTIEEDQTNTNTQKPTQSTGHLQVLRPEHDGNDADGKRVH